MATADQTSQPIPTDQKGIPKSKRKLQKHLRSAGLAYVSRTGKIIPAKKVADELCQCPHKCDELVPQDARQQLFQHFYGLGEADLQNQFLRSNMDLRARLNVPETTGSGRPPRRITCKYLVPLMEEGRSVEVCQKAFVSAFVITTKRVRLQREKLISSLGLNSYRSHNRSKKDREDKNNAAATEANNNNIMLNNNTITLNTLKTKFNLPSNLSLYLPRTASNVAASANETSSSINNNLECYTQNYIEDNSQSAIYPLTPEQNTNVDATEKSILPICIIASTSHVREPNKVETYKRAHVDIRSDLQEGRTERMKLLPNRQKETPPVVPTDDHIDCFFKSLAATARTLSPLNLIEAKKRLFELMSELERKNIYEKYNETILSPNTCSILISSDTSDSMED